VIDQLKLVLTGGPWWADALRVVCGAYLALCVTMFFIQRSALYPADTSKIEFSAVDNAAGYSLLSATAADGVTTAGILQVKADGPMDDGPVVVYYHGNGGHALGRVAKMGGLLRALDGKAGLIVGYRGYGGNPSHPTEDGLIADAAAQFAAFRAQYPDNPLLFYGESLGTGVCSALLAQDAQIKPAALVLEAPFTSALAVAQRQYFFLPVAWLMKDTWRTELRLPKRDDIPLFVIHGSRDGLIPDAMGKTLAQDSKHPATQFISAQAGHNDVWSDKAALETLFKAIRSRIISVD
jgi:fermentation-respiration switch protein FrsA (DUF1100 family)